MTDIDEPLTESMVQKLTLMNKNAYSLVDEALIALFKRDHEGADSVIEKSKFFVEGETEVIRSLNETDTQAYYMLHFLMDSQRRIAEYARDIAETVLDMTVERTLRKQEVVTPQVIYP